MPAPRSAASISRNSSIRVRSDDLVWRAMRMIPKKPASDLIRVGTGFGSDHAHINKWRAPDPTGTHFCWPRARALAVLVKLVVRDGEGDFPLLWLHKACQRKHGAIGNAA